MRTVLLVATVLVLTAVSTAVVLHLRGREVRARASPVFVVSLVAFNVVVYALLVLLVP